jgi:hypothetical protein
MEWPTACRSGPKAALRLDDFVGHVEVPSFCLRELAHARVARLELAHLGLAQIETRSHLGVFSIRWFGQCFAQVDLLFKREAIALAHL